MQKKGLLSIFLLMCYVWSFAQSTETDVDTFFERPKLVVAIKQSPPFTYKGEDGEYTGISVYLWDLIADKLEVEFEYKEMTLPELLKGLEHGTVDLSINPLTVTSRRIKHMTFTQPFYISNSVIVTKERQVDHFQNVMKQVFSYNFLRALLLLIIALVSFGTVIWLFERKKNPQFSNGLHGWWTGIWWSAATMTTVGYGDTSPKGVPGQMIGIFMMFLALLVVSGLMAGITSALTIDKMGDEWEHVQDLRKTKAGTVEKSASDHFLEHHLIKTFNTETVSKGLHSVVNGDLEAFVYDEPLLRWEIEHDSLGDKVRILPFKFNKQYYSFAMPKGKDSLIQHINPILLEILETVEWRAVLSDYELHGL